MKRTNKSIALSIILTLVILATFGLVGCGGATPATTTSKPPVVTTTTPTTTAPTTTPATTLPTTTPATTPPTTTPTVSGAQLYATNCVVCHGANRQGVTSGTTVVGPAVQVTSPTITKYTTQAALSTFLSGHATGIALTTSQRDNLAAFLKTP